MVENLTERETVDLLSEIEFRTELLARGKGIGRIRNEAILTANINEILLRL